MTWHHTVASHSHSRYLERDGSPAEIENYEFPAGFVPNLRFDYSEVPARIPLGQWRAVEHSSNVFVVASVIDELAHATGTDPLAFLQRLIGNQPAVQVRDDFALDTARLQRVIALAARKSGWGKKLAPGHGRGIAASYNQGAWVAEVAQVEVQDDKVRVTRITAAVDCGLVINPTGANAQVEGAILEGLSAALLGEITVEDGTVRQSNFHDYRFCTMRQAPRIDVHFIDSDAEPRGLGEPPLPPVAPAVCNAIFAACGRRIRRLPVKNHLSI
jgi:isoquinoline 1-oxidoreductase beta subunit